MNRSPHWYLVGIVAGFGLAFIVLAVVEAVQ